MDIFELEYYWYRYHAKVIKKCLNNAKNTINLRRKNVQKSNSETKKDEPST